MIDANDYSRLGAILLTGTFGLALLLPQPLEKINRPAIAAGAPLSGGEDLGVHMRLSGREIRRVGEILADAAEHEIMPRFRRLSDNAIRTKSSAFDIVTAADEAAEAVIGTELKKAFPGGAVVGEEEAERDPTLLTAIDTADLLFLVDPIDGTKNFVSRLPLFGVMAAVLVNGEIAAGVIYDPVCRNWAYCLRGDGAWTEDDQGAWSDVRVAQHVPVSEMEGVAGTAFLPDELRETVSHNLARLSVTTWFRCAAHEYRLAASGFCHFLLYNRLMPWDHAAGWLLHREAGGYSAHFDGTPYRPTHRTGGLLYAPNKDSWHAIHDALLSR